MRNNFRKITALAIAAATAFSTCAYANTAADRAPSDEIRSEEPTPLIDEEGALDIAVSDAAVDASLIIEVKTELKTKKDILCYKVKFETENTEYSYLINALDGSVIEKEVEEEEPKEEKPEKDKSDKDKPDKDNAHEETTLITEADALDIAVSDAAVDASLIDEVETDLKKNDGKPYYKVEFETENAEYTYLIDALDGSVIEKEVKEEEHHESPYISKDSAIDIAASDAALDISDIRIQKITLIDKESSPAYKLNIYAGRTKYTYVISAADGTICDKIITEREIEQDYVRGDADGNGRVTSADSAQVMQKVLDDRYKTFAEQEDSRDYIDILDLDDNNIITAADSAAILQACLSLNN